MTETITIKLKLTKEALLQNLRTVEQRHMITLFDRERVDYETSHYEADLLLLEYINDEEIKAAFLALGRWYA